MIDDRYEDSFVDELQELFNPKQVIPSPGLGDVYILKYDNFYLKIYPDENEENVYIIEHHKYSQKVQVPMKIDSVRSNRLRQYAKKLKLN